METQTCEFGFRVAPDLGPHPGVLMIHDVWGLKDHTRDMATRLAREGFHVLAIDLYRDFANKEIEEPGPWIRGLSDPEILADIRAGVSFLSAHPSSAGLRTGVLGFCMGGMYAVLAGCDPAGTASAVVPFYGLLSHTGGLLEQDGGLDPANKPVEPIEAGRNLQCPMLAFFGEDDPYVSMADIDRLEATTGVSGQSAECVRYAGAGHAFMNDTYPDAYRAGAAKDAWGKTHAFLRRVLSA
jgi:carboxymethylenebutenolidase